MEAKGNLRRGLGRVVRVLGVVAAAAAVNAACSEESSSGENNLVAKPSIAPVANDANIESPVDATPSPDGQDIYFIANSKVPGEDNLGYSRQAAIYKVSATGGPITKLHQGDPLVAPFGITISGDGKTLFIADSAAQTSEDRSDGKVYTMPSGGGTPSALPGTEGLAPGGVEVAGDTLYITGKKDNKAGLFKTGLGGGAVTPVAVGEHFTDPGGAAVAKNGDVYVVDTGSPMNGEPLASVVKVSPDGKTAVVASGLSVGHPAGIALTNDDSTIYVSGFDSAKGTDVVFAVNAATHEIGTFTDSIENFAESAGLHRARNSNVFAWADGHANGSGTVYVLRQ
jgi:sugar lactone lactonase YvrE